MPQTVSRHFEWSGDWGGYMFLTVTFDLTAVIDDEATSMACTITNLNQYFEWGVVQGYGFINVGGVMWAADPFSARYPNPDTAPEVWADVEPELTQACPGIPDDVVYGLYASDEGSPPAVAGQFGQATTGQAVAHTFALSGQPSGSMMILTPFERYRDNAAGEAVVDSQGGFSVSWSDLVGDYYPGARRLSGSWASCDREGGSVGRRGSGAWDPVKNGGDSDEAFRRAGGEWAASPKCE